MNREEIIKWLLEGDVSIQYQVHRDLLDTDKKDLQNRIANEGWGHQFMSKRKSDGNWGLRYYQPKWTSTHYTLLELRYLCISPNNKLIQESIKRIVENEKGVDGGINPSVTIQLSDMCVNGMFLNFASYFKSPEEDLHSLVDCLLEQRMVDGGFNCQLSRYGAVHSSLHTTISVLEGITEYEKQGYLYRLDELIAAKESSIEFILIHKLFQSDKTGKTIKDAFLKLSYPCRWRYDILRAMDYFQHAGVKWDERMRPALDIILKKRNKNSTWNVQAKHAGKVHFEMEKAGKPSRWNTLRVLRVLKHFGIED